MSDSLYNKDEPSSCIVSDSCKYIIDLRSIESPFIHLDTDEFSMMCAEISAAASLLRENAELLDSFDTPELIELTRALFSLQQQAEEIIRDYHN